MEELDPRDISPLGRTDIEEEMQELADHVLLDPPLPTMGGKLIIEAGTPGHSPSVLWQKVGVDNMPPYSMEDQAQAIIACARAGAAAVHTHPRDPGNPYNYEAAVGRAMAPELLKDLLDRVYNETDIVPLGHAWHPKDWEALAEADFITPTQELLEIGGGNRYIQGNVVPTWIFPMSRRGLLSTWFTAASMQRGVAWLEEHNVKPCIALHLEHLDWVKAVLLDSGVLRTRPHINIQEGKHGVNRSLADPMAHQNIIPSIETVRRLVPDCTLGLHAGGRNWLPMTVMGIMLGVDLVRVGIEDQFWAYPHRDEPIRHPAEAVARVARIAEALGREIATPPEAREILGIRLTP